MSAVTKVTDYLLMRTPTPRLGGQKPRAAAGQISGSRIAISLLGIILGIIASFYVTGLHPAAETGNSSAGQSQQGSTTTQPGTSTPAPQPTVTPATTPQPAVSTDFSWNRLWKIGLISLVICGITYQGLYSSLRLYQNEPALLILFVAFQYGYFWQSVVKGAAAIAST
jgi:ABC-type antimicrobial peptide transport system permease subunit